MGRTNESVKGGKGRQKGILSFFGTLKDVDWDAREKEMRRFKELF